LNGEEIRLGKFGLFAMIEGLRAGGLTSTFFWLFNSIIVVLLLVFTSSLTNKSDHFQSSLTQVTSKIKTPAAVGQGQHGSAKWMTEAQADEIFTSYIIDIKNDNALRILLENGIREKALINNRK